MVSLFINASGALAVAILFPLLCSIVVSGRFYVRRSRKISFGWDDWTILFATCGLWIQSILIIIGVAMHAFGVHSDIDVTTGRIVTTSQTTLAVKLADAYYLCFPVSLGATKISVVLFFRRLFVGTKFRIWSACLCVFIVVWCTGWFFSSLLQCGTHVSAFWSGLAAIKEYCDDPKAQMPVVTVLDVVTDIMVLATPLPSLWKLQMRFSQKAALFAIFLLGFLSCAVAITRLYWVFFGPFTSILGERDLAAINTLNTVWAQIEVGVAIFAATLPTLRALFLGSSPESLLGSLRSVVSLRSLSSKSSRLEGGKQTDITERSDSSDKHDTDVMNQEHINEGNRHNTATHV